MNTSIKEVVRATGLTSRALRHYDAIGLLPATSTAPGGVRLYNDAALARLQRILLLRDAGLGLAEIRRALENETDDVEALSHHVALLRDERERLDRRIRSVELTITQLTEGEALMPQTSFDGFNHTEYREEVEQRWGADAYQAGADWWRRLGAAGQQAHRDEDAAIVTTLAELVSASAHPTSPEAQALVTRHRRWIAASWSGGAPDDAYLGLVEMYVADARFAAHYGGQAHAEFLLAAVRESLGR